MNLNPAQDQFSTFHKLMHIVADAHMSHGSEYMSGWGGGEEFCGVRPFSTAVRSARSSVLKYSKASFRFNVSARRAGALRPGPHTPASRSCNPSGGC